ncbi:MAG: hypothetical protein NW205_06360 [Hyphomicrobiaceae bacterium]|nr:hypothetical protein [Hyphomicrobiaceae bacterium]
MFRIAECLKRAGVPVDCEFGETDEGDPWACYCNTLTGEVLIHIAHVNELYVADIAMLAQRIEGRNFDEIVARFHAAYPVTLQPSSAPGAARVWSHPGSAFVALVLTLYMLHELSSAGPEGEQAQTIDVDAVVVDDEDGAYPAAAAFADDAYARSMKSELGKDTSSEGPRTAVLAAALAVATIVAGQEHVDLAALIAGVDVGSAIAGLTPAESDEANALLALADVKAQGAVPGAAAADGEPTTGYAVADTAGVDVRFGLEGLNGDLLDGREAGHGEVSEIGHELGQAFAVVGSGPSGDVVDLLGQIPGKDAMTGYIAALAGANALGGVDGAAHAGDGRADSAAAALDGPATVSEAGRAGSDVYGANDLVAALGLDTQAFEIASASDLAGLFGTLSPQKPVLTPVALGPSDGGGASGGLGSPEGGSSLSGGDISGVGGGTGTGVVFGSGDGTDFGAGGSGSGGTSGTSGGQGGSNPSQGGHGDVRVAIDTGRPDLATNGMPFADTSTDLSEFDVFAVVKAFIDNVGDVGVAVHDRTFYIFDRAPESASIEVETLHVANGDVINLIGQSETFDAIYDLLA